jgi:hypothetical protein
MGPYLGMWFVYCLVVSICLGMIAFFAYGGALPQMAIWYRRSWATTLKSSFDSAIYGAVSGAAFGWLWPQ